MGFHNNLTTSFLVTLTPTLLYRTVLLTVIKATIAEKQQLSSVQNMSGRGRGRGRGGAGTDTGAGRARRSTRQAAVQQQEQSEPTPSINTQSPAQQSNQAIPSQDGLMGPPPPPGIKNVQGPSVYQFSRRGAPRSERGGSLASLNSVAVSDSVYTAMTSQADHLSESASLPGSPIVEGADLDSSFIFLSLFLLF